MFCLEIADPARGSLYRFVGAEEAVMGRDHDCDVIIDHHDVHLHHARIYRGPDGWRLEDLGSKSTLRIDGEIIESVVLQNDQSFLLGPAKITFYEGSTAPAPESEELTACTATPDARRPISLLDFLAGSGVLFAVLVQVVFGVAVVLWWRGMDTTRPPAPPPEQVARPQPPPSPSVDPLPVGPPTPVDPGTEPMLEDSPTPLEPSQVERMLQLALEQRADNDVYAAAEQLQRLLSVQPGYVPAMVELAEVYTFRGEWVSARDLWRRMLEENADQALVERAASELQQLEGRIRLEALAGVDLVTDDVERRPIVNLDVPYDIDPVRRSPEPRLPIVETPRRDRVVIHSVELQTLPAAHDREEMRLLHAEVVPRSAAFRVAPARVRIDVRFFDRDGRSGRIIPTTATQPDALQRLTGKALRISEPQTVTFGYVVPQGQRGRERVTENLDLSYYGYILRLYYGDSLQDQLAEPATLLEDASF